MVNYARVAVFYHFILKGIIVGILSSFLPRLQNELELSDSQLGVATLFASLGALCATPVSAFLLRMIGSRTSTGLGAFLYALSLPLIPLANNFSVFIAAWFAFGFNGSLMDVAINSYGVLTELVADETFMGAYHGSYSVAAALGSLLGGALQAIDSTAFAIFGVVALISVCLTLGVWLNGVPHKQEIEIAKNSSNTSNANEALTAQITDEDDFDDANKSRDGNERTSSVSEHEDLPPNSISSDTSSCCNRLMSMRCIKDRLFFLAAVGFLAVFGEGGLATWSVVYFNRYITTDSSNSPPVVSSTGFFAFFVTMALGRFSCDYLRQRFGRDVIVKASGLLASAGLAAAILAPALVSINFNLSIAVATVGLAITGCGLSTLVPTMFSSAGHVPGRHSSSSIAIVAAFTFSGGSLSSPMIGGLSDAFTSLQYALIVVAAMLFLISPLGYGVPREDHASYLLAGADSRRIVTSTSGKTINSSHYTPLISDDSIALAN